MARIIFFVLLFSFVGPSLTNLTAVITREAIGIPAYLNLMKYGILAGQLLMIIAGATAIWALLREKLVVPLKVLAGLLVAFAGVEVNSAANTYLGLGISFHPALSQAVLVFIACASIFYCRTLGISYLTEIIGVPLILVSIVAGLLQNPGAGAGGAMNAMGLASMLSYGTFVILGFFKFWKMIKRFEEFSP